MGRAGVRRKVEGTWSVGLVVEVGEVVSAQWLVVLLHPVPSEA